MTKTPAIGIRLLCCLALITIAVSAACAATVPITEIHESKEMIEPFRSLLLPEGTKAALWLSLTERYLAGGVGKKTIVWDIQSASVLHEFPGFGASTFSPTGDLLLKRMPEGIGLYRPGEWDRPFQVLPYRREDFPVIGLTFSANGEWLAVSGNPEEGAELEARIDLHRRPFTGQPETEVRKPNCTFLPIALSPDGSLLAAAIRGVGQIEIYDTTTGELLFSLRPSPVMWNLFAGSSTYDVAFSPDGRWLASVHHESTLRIWDLRSRIEAGCYEFPQKSDRWKVAFSPDGRFLVASVSSFLAIWEVEGWRLVTLFKGKLRSAFGLTFSPDGKLLAMGQYDSVTREVPAIGGGYARFEVHTNYVAVHRFEELIKGNNE